MQVRFEDIKIQLKNRFFYTIAILYLFIIMLLAFAGYTGYSVYNMWTKIAESDIQIETYKTSATLIRNNKQLIGSSIDDLNATLLKIIPDDESYFLVVSALEKLAAKTGVDISSYTIDLESTNASTLTLNVEITGTLETLEAFYKNYLFSGGRLITSDKVELSDSGDAKIIVSMNFYHMKYTDGAQSTIQQLQQKDIDFIDEVATKLE